MDETAQIKELVDIVWEKTVSFCSKVVSHSKIYGFGLMHIPDPDIHKVHDLLTVVVLPVLEALSNSPHLPNEDGMKVDNIKQYILHIKMIVQAIENEDEEAFALAVSKLDNESFLPPTS
ncbi:MAG: hypothetical protein PSN46_06640 [Gammaproteobacteria bacterium]|nr:hypothetical protein [Gammaproteobacteria bacterium]